MTVLSLTSDGPTQCLVFFEPLQWSKRYAETFFTLNTSNISVDSNIEFLMKCGTNEWKITRTVHELNCLLTEIVSNFVPTDSTTNVHIPTSLPSPISPESLDHILQDILTLPEICIRQKSIRRFFELDRPLIIREDLSLTNLLK